MKHFARPEKDKCPILDLKQNLDRSERMFVTKDNDRIPILKSAVPLTGYGEDMILECFIKHHGKDRSPGSFAEKRRTSAPVECHQDKFFSIIAHDLRGPFSSILDTLICSLSKSGNRNMKVLRCSPKPFISRLTGPWTCW